MNDGENHSNKKLFHLESGIHGLMKKRAIFCSARAELGIDQFFAGYYGQNKVVP